MSYNTTPTGTAPRLRAAVSNWISHTLERALTLIVPILALAERRWRSRPARRARPAAQKICVVRVDLLGDVVNSLWVARAVKDAHPSSRVTFVTLPQTKAIAELCPDVDEVISVDINQARSWRDLPNLHGWKGLLRDLRRLRTGTYDIAISLCGPAGSIATLAVRSRLRVGFESEGYRQIFDRPVPGGRAHDDHPERDAFFSARLLEAAVGFKANGQFPRPSLVFDTDTSNQVDRLLVSHGVGPHVRFALFHLGATQSAYKQWPPEHFGLLAKMLLEIGVVAVSTGTPSDRRLAESAGLTGPIVNLCGQTTLPELAALIDRSQLVVSGDSGPLHLAAALGVPAIGIFGPTDPLRHGPAPWAPEATRTVRSSLGCSPCFKIGHGINCPYGRPLCMERVSPQEVYQAAVAALRASGSLPLTL